MKITKLTEANTAFDSGNFSKADKLFAKAEAKEKLTLQQFAKIAFNRGQIAEQDLRWKDAAEHYARAANLDPSFDTLLKAQRLALAIGDYDSALSLGREVKKVAIAEYGEESTEYALSLNNLGGVYQEKGLDEEAEPLYNESLIIHKKLLGENHLNNAPILNNLAEIYRKQGELKKAEQFFKKALKIDKKVLGEEHPETATDMNNLGGLYRQQKKYTKSESLYQQALTIRKKILEKNHPDIAISFNNLAVLYEDQKKYKKAGPLYLQAIKIFETVLGPEHHNTKIIKYNYDTFERDLANAESAASQ